MNKKNLFSLFVVIILLFLTNSIYGAGSGVGLNVGYIKPADTNYGSDSLYGLSLSFEIINKYIAVEFSGLRYQSDVTGVEDSLSAGKATVTPIQLTLQLRWPLLSRLTLYLSGGGGYYWSKFVIDPKVVNDWNALNFDVEEKIKGAFGFHGGAGVDYFIFRKIAVNIDFKYCLVKTSGVWTLTDRISTAETSGEIEEINLDAIMLAAGIKIFF